MNNLTSELNNPVGISLSLDMGDPKRNDNTQKDKIPKKEIFMAIMSHMKKGTLQTNLLAVPRSSIRHFKTCHFVKGQSRKFGRGSSWK